MLPEKLTDRTVNNQQRKETRRGELVEAAFNLFVEKGFAATRLEDVAVRAGVAKGTVVVYFATKEALFTAVVRDYLEPQLTRAESVLGEGGSPSERIRRLVGFIHASLIDPHLGALPKLIVSEVAHFPDLARQFHHEVCERSRRVYAELIRQGIASGEFRAVDPEIHARLLLDPLLMQAIWRHSLHRYEACPVDAAAYTAAHLDTFLRGIAAQP